MVSVDFGDLAPLQTEGSWLEIGEILADAARSLERGGADFIILCTNTMHKVADAIASSVSIPLLHIADATASAIRASGIRRVGLLGTRFTMEEDFYVGRMREAHELDVLVPNETGRSLVHQIIYDELCLGRVLPSSREAYLGVIRELIARGAEGIILGCTEIMMLVSARDVDVPVFDTTTLHAEAAFDFAAGKTSLPRPPRPRS